MSTARKTNGITLIALVVTIVVLLILAGVTITMVLGKDGIIAQAKLAAEKTKEAEEQQEQDLEGLVGQINEAVNGKDPDKMQDAVESHKVFAYTTGYDENGNKINEEEEPDKTPKITIPAGFKIIEGSIEKVNEGIVIADEAGNEFVWVPCTETEYTKHVYTGNDNNDENINLPDGEGKDQGWNTWYYRKYKDWIGDPNQEGANKASVQKYGGFYIARYEAGVPSNADFYVSATSENKTYAGADKKNVTTYKPVSQKGKQAWNLINQSNAKTVSENMYKGSSSVKSQLVDGIAWDRTVDWIVDTGSYTDIEKNSTTHGNYANNNGEGKITESNILFAEHLYKVKTDGNVNSGWCIGKNYKVGEFTSGWTEKWNDELEGGSCKDYYANYDSDTLIYYYRHYVEMATGASEKTKLNNIYDLAGNMYEWTTERGSHKETEDTTTTYDKKTSSVLRGGGFDNSGSNNPVSVRDGDGALGSTSPNFGFRVVLYVK